MSQIIPFIPPMTPVQEVNLEIEQASAELQRWNSLLRQAFFMGDRRRIESWRESRDMAEQRLHEAIGRKSGLEDMGSV